MDLMDAQFDGLKYEMQEEDAPHTARIKVIGVGGGGSNAVAHMLNAQLSGVDFCILNTDLQALSVSQVPKKLSIGYKVTRGRGAGADPAVGREAALEDTERIVEVLEGADMVFVTAGLGSGTGTGAAPVVASLAKNLNALTVAIVTMPFSFEGKLRINQAQAGLAELAATVDTVIAIPNDRLLGLAPKGTSIVEAFRMGNDILRQIVQDIVEIITTPGLINRDFSDIRSTMFGQGCASMGTGTASGEEAVVEAARLAIHCPLLQERGINGARNLLVAISGKSENLGLHEIDEALTLIREASGSEDVQLNFGVLINEALGEAIKVTIIATGFPKKVEMPALPPAAASGEPEWFSTAPAAVVEEAPVVEVPVEPVAAPPVVVEQPAVDPDDLDTPAYLRRRR